MRGVIVLVLGLLVIPQVTPVSENTAIVRKWADTIGEELWSLFNDLTNINEIKLKYNKLHIKVNSKNESSILTSAVESVGKMLQRKIDAVKCIHHKAESLARDFEMTDESRENFTYYSSKYSYMTMQGSNDTDFDEEEEDTRPESAAMDSQHYENLTLNEDSHFYNIPVNTENSCVQVPTNIYDQEDDALEAILWSKELDETFIQNYESDPSLSWQYFGSSAGILRLFPGMPWNKKEVDVFDCRVRSWYIEAATCSKDVIVLFDVSGSMTGFRNYVARNTLKTILETLSNNDFINVYTFKNETREAVACFTNLVQATPENVKTIMDALEPTDGGKKHKVPLEGYANLTTAYITAFEKLSARRKNCTTSQETQGCNQLVMLITDYVPGNLTEVFDTYNREMVGNETRIPVRVFTYLIGKEVTNVREIQWMACLNRGYYVHIHSIEEVQQQVLKYINVIARPMILEGAEPPPTWTHAYIDDTRTSKWGVSNQIDLPDSDKLVTSVAIPAFKTNKNGSNGTTAELLGVAGTDVPIDSIAKLAQPHQLGVNGYSFIVSNNGYLLLHPYLVPSRDGRLQINLNSVDIVEVEQVDDGKGARDLGDEISRLRQDMVYGKNAEFRNVSVLFHYDKMRRIAQVKQHYFYNKLEGTPFSLGISLPDGYGKTYLDVGDIWELNDSEVRITDYFNSSYRVHPDWIYCKYHYLEGHEMDTPEMEVWHFLRKMNEPGWKWSEQYSSEDPNSSKPSSEPNSCSMRAKLDKDDYYCNKDLIQMLALDAKLTDTYFKEWEGDLTEAKRYGVRVRFVSTASGLTRWHYLIEDGMNEIVNDTGYRETKDAQYDETKTFGDKYPRAIEEIWYMSAVLQHEASGDETLVVAVDFADEQSKPENGTEEEPAHDVTVTASYAIYARENGLESPASVVGLQFDYDKWRERFVRVTSEAHLECASCIKTCNESGVHCYLVDSSGYVVLAEEEGGVGQFFGEQQPRVMISMKKHELFKEMAVFDYQATCGPGDLHANVSAAAWRLGTPFNAVEYVLKLFIVQLMWLLEEVVVAAAHVIVSDDYFDELEYKVPDPTPAPPPPTSDEPEPSTEPFSCDKRVQLYILQPAALHNGAYEKRVGGNCTPAYTAVAVKHSNLLFVAVDERDWAPMPECQGVLISTRPQPTEESTQSKIPCHKLDLGKLERRRLEGCYTYHKKEAEIDACGDGSLSRLHAALLPATAAVLAAAPRLLP